MDAFMIGMLLLTSHDRPDALYKSVNGFRKAGTMINFCAQQTNFSYNFIFLVYKESMSMAPEKFTDHATNSLKQ